MHADINTVQPDRATMWGDHTKEWNTIKILSPGDKQTEQRWGEHGGCENYDVPNRQQSQSDQHLTTTGRGVAMGVTSIEVGGG